MHCVYKCLSCEKQFNYSPKSLVVYDKDLDETRNLGKSTDTVCIYCGHSYVYWVNFEEFTGRKR